MRPADLAREHGLSPQAVRTYEAEGALPPAARTTNGYRVYTQVHAAALHAYLAAVRAHGYAPAREILRAVNRRDDESALRAIDTSHAQLQQDRSTLRAVEVSLGLLTGPTPPAPVRPARAVTVGALGRRLGLTPATLRAWERAGILRPHREHPHRQRAYTPDDVRDAQLAHLLRRGGYPLAHIAVVVEQVRTAGGTAALAASLADWQARLTARGRAMLTAAARLDAYLDVLAEQSVPPPP